MLTYPLTKTGGVSLYEQLYRRIKDDILTWRPIWRSVSSR